KRVVSDTSEFLGLATDEQIKIIDEFKEKHSYSTAKEIKARETEEKYIYDIRILNALSTTGLKSASIAHRLDNKRNNISTYYDKVVKGLKKLELWDVICSPQNTRYKYTDIP